MNKPQYFENLITPTTTTTTFVAIGDPFPGLKINRSYANFGTLCRSVVAWLPEVRPTRFKQRLH